jgi:hypothetical protein
VRRCRRVTSMRIDGFDRCVVKIAVNIMFNAESRRSAVRAIAKALHDDAALHAASGVDTHHRWWVNQTFTKNLLEAIEHKHRRIEDYFGSDCGARFQRLDSDMAMEVMTRMIGRTGRCPLPIHDSFLVADIDAEWLKETMVQVAGQHGLVLKLKESRAVCTTIEDLISSRSPLVVLNTDLQQPQPAVDSSLCPVQPSRASTPLEVTTPDLQGLKSSKESVRPLWDIRDGGRGVPTTRIGPRSPVRKPNWHHPP